MVKRVTKPAKFLRDIATLAGLIGEKQGRCCIRAFSNDIVNGPVFISNNLTDCYSDGKIRMRGW